ncbi:MAG TPA: M48 family metallopeptidase [Nostocaceae cyanobacterium]|nr:M48 family metallopeptidase [Nostocaceae cyanobacterium]
MNNWKDYLTKYRLWRRRWIYPLISLSVAIGLCLSTPLPGKAIDLLPLIFQGVQVIQLSNISDRQEIELGQQMNDELRSQDVIISSNTAITRYVDQIGQKLVANRDRRNIPYTFQVVEDDSVNAFATMGGFVYVNTGLIKTAENESELASVIGHEIGHIEGKHALKQIRQSAIASGVATLAGVDRNKIVGLGVELALKRPRSRQDEYDADKRGLNLLTRAGYAQSGMVSFMQKLISNRSVPTILSTHPNSADRVKALQKLIAAKPSKSNLGLDTNTYKNTIRTYLR